MTKPKSLQRFVVPASERRRNAWPAYLVEAAAPGSGAMISANIQITDSGCWEWCGQRNEKNYGIIWTRGTTLFAHRLSLLVAGVEFEPEQDVDHLCLNPPCINPAHLEPVTHTENVRRGRATIKTGKCGKGHDNWRYYRTGKQCDTCNRIRKGRTLNPTP